MGKLHSTSPSGAIETIILPRTCPLFFCQPGTVEGSILEKDLHWTFVYMRGETSQVLVRPAWVLSIG